MAVIHPSVLFLEQKATVEDERVDEGIDSSAGPPFPESCPLVPTTPRKIGVNAVTLRILLRTKDKGVTERVTEVILVTSPTVITGDESGHTSPVADLFLCGRGTVVGGVVGAKPTAESFNSPPYNFRIAGERTRVNEMLSQCCQSGSKVTAKS